MGPSALCVLVTLAAGSLWGCGHHQGTGGAGAGGPVVAMANSSPISFPHLASESLSAVAQPRGGVRLHSQRGRFSDVERGVWGSARPQGANLTRCPGWAPTKVLHSTPPSWRARAPSVAAPAWPTSPWGPCCLNSALIHPPVGSRVCVHRSVSCPHPRLPLRLVLLPWSPALSGLLSPTDPAVPTALPLHTLPSVWLEGRLLGLLHLLLTSPSPHSFNWPAPQHLRRGLLQASNPQVHRHHRWDLPKAGLAAKPAAVGAPGCHLPSHPGREWQSSLLCPAVPFLPAHLPLPPEVTSCSPVSPPLPTRCSATWCVSETDHTTLLLKTPLWLPVR